ncbi:MAG TPA: TonB-dependent receptor [Opitutaceae bacterium]
MSTIKRSVRATNLKALFACLLAAPALPAFAQSESDAAEAPADDVVRLPGVQVVASADASAGGLSEAYAGGQVATSGRIGLFGSQDYMATPFSFTSYTQQLIKDQQAASIGEVLLNDPAVRVARGFGNFQQLYLVRGLPVYSDDMAYNGLYGLLPRQYLAAEFVERVEVLRGANAFLNGAAPGGSGLGGAVNVMPKRAPNEPLTQLTAGVQSGGQLYGALDVARRFSENRAGVRVNVAQRDGDTAVDGESTQLGLAAIGFDYRFGALRVSADVGYQDLQKEASQPSVTISSGLAIPTAPDASLSVAQPWTFSNERDAFGTLRAEYDLGREFTAWVAAGLREGNESAIFANPTVVSAGGTTSSYRFENVREDSVATGEAGLRARFATGSLDHQVSASASLYRLDSKNAYAFSNFAGFTNELYAPTVVAMPAADFFTGGSMAKPLITETTDTTSFAVADVVSLLDARLFLTGGLRYQKIDTRSYDYNTGAPGSLYAEHAVTPVGGVVYRLTKKTSLYANYIEGLTKGDVAPATSGSAAVVNAGEVLAPYQTEQFELGFKFDAGRLGGTVSVFESRKPVAGVGDGGVFRVLDHQRHRGLEVSSFGELTTDLRLLGGLSLLDTDADGRDAIGAPKTQANVGLEWLPPFLAGFSLDGRAIYTSRQYADSANTQEVPSWKRFDLGARYVVSLGERRSLTLRARAENVADRDYWASAGGYPGAGYLTVGAPRTFLFSATLDF